MTHPLQHKVNRTIVTVSGLTPQVVVSATSGVTVNIVDIQLKNNQNYAIDVGVYEESTLVTPTVPLGPSGTYLAEDLGLGFGLRLTDGSGVKATAGPVGTADVMIAWTPFDVEERHLTPHRQQQLYVDQLEVVANLRVANATWPI